MKISIITACWNSAATLRDAMASVASQRLAMADGGSGSTEAVELEYIVVDGGSTDGTVELIKEFEATAGTGKGEGGIAESFSFKWISERDRGLYDALNKGIGMATGEIVGICNADDVLASDMVVARIASAFGERKDEEGTGNKRGGLDAVYADIRFVRDDGRGGRGGRGAGNCGFDGLEAARRLRTLPSVRYCTGKYFRKWMFRFATFPAHPSTFVRRECFDKYGLYSLDYPICADFEMMLRLFVVHGIRVRYLPLCTHVMRMGGASTGGLRSNIAINDQDLRALRSHGIRSCLPLIYLKYFAKIWGFLRRG